MGVDDYSNGQLGLPPGTDLDYGTRTVLYMNKADRDAGKTDACFIATAAYGDHNHQKVAVLRNFRDKTLLRSRAGRIFVTVYYFLSPPIAAYIKHRRWLRAVTVLLLTPIVLVAEWNTRRLKR